MKKPPPLSEVPMAIDGQLYFVSTKTLLGRLQLEKTWAEFQLQRAERKSDECRLQEQETDEVISTTIAFLDPDRQPQR